MDSLAFLLTSLIVAQNAPDVAQHTQAVESIDARPVAERNTWASSRPRAFVATQIDAGYLYLRPRVAVGYGRPHFQWLGLEANPIVTNGAVAGWAGLRASTPFADLRAGARTVYSLQRGYLAELDSYERLDLERSAGSHAKYSTLEAELSAGVSTSLGDFGGLASVSYVTGVPADRYLFEEQLRMIVAPPWVVRVRGEYGAHLIPGRRNVTFGLAVDALDAPARHELLVRAGFVTRIVLSRALEIRGSFLMALVSKDFLGLVQSDFTELGIRYRWASGD